MKKFFLMLAFVASFVTANAGDYKFLTVQQTNGAEQSFTASGLTITFSQGNMVLNENGTSTTVSLSGLSKMYFSDEATGIETLGNASSATDGTVIYDLQGRKVATSQSLNVLTSQSLNVLTSQLPKGVYIVKQGDRSYKITVK